MSVINKLLSEMDKRESVEHGKYVPPVKKSRLNLILGILVAVIALLVVMITVYKYQDLEQQVKAKLLVAQEIAQQKQEKQAPRTQENTLSNKAQPLNEELATTNTNIKEDNNTSVKEEINNKVNEGGEPLTKSASAKEPQIISLVNSNSARAIKEDASDKQKLESTNKVEEIVFDNSANIEYLPVEDFTQEKAKSMKISSSKLTLAQELAIYHKDVNAAIAQGNKKGAVASLKSILSRKPSDIKARERLASIYYGEGNIVEVAKVLNKGIELTPHHYDYRLYLARAYASASQNELAIKVLRQANPPINGNVDYYATLATLARNSGDFASAEYAYQKLSTLKTSEGRWYMGLGIVLEQQKKKDKALAAYKKALGLYLSSSSSKFVKQRIKVLGSSDE